jgi:hypothetical protein
LESACYALLITTKPELEPVWSDRDKGGAERKASRKAFGSAVADVIKILDLKDAGLGAFVSRLYESSIDHGAHPNSLGIWNNVQVALPLEDQKRFDQGSIYPGNSLQVFRALNAALEYGRAVALILAYCLPVLTEDVAEPLRELQRQYARVFDVGSPSAPSTTAPAR